MPDFADIRWQLEQRKREVGIGATGVVLAIGIILLGWWWFAVKWQPPPSIFDSPVEDVLGYLSMDDFSQMSLDERIAFLVEFSDRFRGMSQEDSAAMAAFLAGLSGPVREQATENARLLAKDILADGASTYLNLPAEDRAAYMDEWLAQWTRLGERITRGEERAGTDEERVTRLKDRAQEGSTRERDPERIRPLTTTGAVRFMDFWAREVETSASPREQGQIVLFMRDLRKHLTSSVR